MSITQLVSGLGGAIGSDFSPTRNALFFVEFDGKVSRYDLTRAAAGSASAGTGTLHGTWLFDLDAGSEVAPNGTADIWWEQVNATERKMVPQGGAKIAWLGQADFNGLSHADLQQVAFAGAPIDGSVGTTTLEPGNVFAVLTNQGNYAKVRILSYGYNLQIEWRTYRLRPAYQVLGTGWVQPEDIALAANGAQAWVTERGGSFLKLELANANRAQATLVADGLNAPHQIVLDEEHGVAYLVEFADPGRILRIDLVSGAETVLFDAVANGIGLALSADGNTAWVTEQPSDADTRLVRVDLATRNKSVVLPGLTAAFFLRWVDASRSALYLVERDPANAVRSVDVTTGAISSRVVASGLPSRPSSVYPIPGPRLLVCSDTALSSVELAAGAFSAAGTYLLGIGHVPATAISADGYATTDASYFFHVVDCPFGGTLPVMINHERAFGEGNRYYQVYLKGVKQTAAFTDYQWSTALNRFVAVTVAPDDSGYWPVRAPSQLWYNHWLGGLVNTGAIPDGAAELQVRIFSAPNAGSLVATQSVTLRIDNTAPLVSIDAIEHLREDGTWESIGRCAIVSTPQNQFRFRITARDPEQHLLSWSLGAVWGDNEGATIDHGEYVPAADHHWSGPAGEYRPAGNWAALETRCAHTFRLSAWDRTINGWGYLHYREYTKSITLWLPVP